MSTAVVLLATPALSANAAPRPSSSPAPSSRLQRQQAAGISSPVATIILPTTATVTASVTTREALNTLEFGLQSPNTVVVCNDAGNPSCGSLPSVSLGQFSSGTELVFYFTDRSCNQTFPSTDTTHARIDQVSGSAWTIYWDDAGAGCGPDGDFNDLIADVSLSNGPPNGPPLALMSALPVNWTGPYTLAFDGTGSFDPDGQVVAYHWTFGDGGSSSAASPTWSYLGPGTFDVSLTVTDDGGATATTSQQLHISGVPSVDFAPEVRLHPDEDHFPMNPYTFIADSKLVWAHDQGCSDDYHVDSVDPSILGRAGGYEHREANSPFHLCHHKGPKYQSNDLTRPFESNPARVSIGDEEGFYLDFDESNEPDSFSPVPVWTERRAPNTITYWFFYGRSVPRNVDDEGLTFQHEGDWEHVNVVLDPVTQVPTTVQYFAHKGGADPHPYTEVIRSQILHPVAYSARTAHGSYPDTGTTEICEFTICIYDFRADGGAVWETWHDVRPADQQGWYDFGGAWGHKGQEGFLDTTGPLGPSQWKDPL